MNLHPKMSYPYPSSVLADSLGLKTRDLISLVGAGGKTTLMFRLAGELCLIGKKVVTTTTTKIFEPSSKESGSVFVDSDEKKIRQWVQSHLNTYRHVTVAKDRVGSGKLMGISLSLVSDLWRSHEMDYIVIEADGAAGRPVKAPRKEEPVLPSSTTLLVGVLGVDGVGKKLAEENVFQVEQVSKITGVPIGADLTVEAIAILMTDPQGVFKGAPFSSRRVAFINKTDIPGGMIKAKNISKIISEKKNHQIERIVLGQLKKEPSVSDVIFP
jgi:probable selenium-dependent hydroxylase accessory protein YqeC